MSSYFDSFKKINDLNEVDLYGKAPASISPANALPNAAKQYQFNNMNITKGTTSPYDSQTMAMMGHDSGTGAGPVKGALNYTNQGIPSKGYNAPDAQTAAMRGDNQPSGTELPARPEEQSWWNEFLNNNPNLKWALDKMGAHPVATTAGATLIALGMYVAARKWNEFRKSKMAANLNTSMA